ncbi:MAG: PilZ domain-containing protein, partial [Actinomycetota bacterium]
AMHEVRGTLLALSSVYGVARTIVVDLSARPEIAAMATEFDALYAATDPADGNGLAVMGAVVGTPEFALLDAGDIPTRDMIGRLGAALADERVAIVQGLGTAGAADSAEHGPDQHHELDFERTALNPALGRRGCAIWTGSGSAARTGLVLAMSPGSAPALEAQWQAGAALLAAGWRVEASEGTPVVAHRAVVSDAAVNRDRQRRVRAARALTFGRGGVLRPSALTVRQRLALLAWSVRPLSAYRRSAFLLLIAAALLTGSVPFNASAIVLAASWLSATTLTALGLGLASDWTLRPGDRARWSLHSLGPAWSGLRSGRERPGVQYGHGLAIMVGALGVVLVVRGISDRWTHWLGEMPRTTLMGVLLVCLWTMALSLDVLRVLARRDRRRRTERVVSSLSAMLGDHAVSLVDLTPGGAGLTQQHPVEVGSRMVLESAVPTASGVTDIRIDCIVRNARTLVGRWRVGVEFTAMGASAANTLVEFCVIEPARDRLGAESRRVAGDSRQVIYVDDATSGPHRAGRLIVRLVSLLALVGTVASTAATAAASPSTHHRVAGVVVPADTPEVATGEPVPDTGPHETVPFDTVPPDSGLPIDQTAPATGSFVVVGVCSTDAGVDGAYGTADDSFGEPVAVVTAADGSFTMDLVGLACWAMVEAPQPAEVAPASQPLAALEVVDVSGAPARVEVVVPGNGSTDRPALASGRASAVAEVRAALAQLADTPDAAHVGLPAPTPEQLATGGGSQSRLSVLVLMIAGLLAASILIGSARNRPAPR